MAASVHVQYKIAKVTKKHSAIGKNHILFCVSCCFAFQICLCCFCIINDNNRTSARTLNHNKIQEAHHEMRQRT